MATIYEMIDSIQDEIKSADENIEISRRELDAIVKTAENQGRTTITAEEDERTKYLFSDIERFKAAKKRSQARLAKAEKVRDEEMAYDARARDVRPSGAPIPRAHESRMHVTSEPRTYSRDKDPEAKGEQFLADVVNMTLGRDPNANERLARHQREWDVDNPKAQARAAGDAISTGFPNLVIPQYLTALYAAKPSNARPFADICRHENLPPEGMKVELAKGNTVSTAAIQTTELVAPSGTSHDDDPLELSVETAESWQQISLQAVQRGRVTEQIVVNDLLDGMHAAIDTQLLTESTTGLFDSSTLITYTSASPTITELYPYILQGASKSSQALLNRGAPTHVIMAPRRWFWLQAQLTSTWPWMTQPGVPSTNFGVNDAGQYGSGRAGRLPCGLDVIIDMNVQQTALGAAQTGGSQDVVYIVPQSECILFEPPQREVFIRAEQPLAKNLGVLLVVYEFFAYTFQRFAATAFQKIDGTGTVAPTGY